MIHNVISYCRSPSLSQIFDVKNSTSIHSLRYDLTPTKNTPTMAKMTPLPTNKYLVLLSIIIGHSLLGGYYAGTRPEGAGWRFFSWHPFLMMVGTFVNFCLCNILIRNWTVLVSMHLSLSHVTIALNIRTMMKKRMNDCYFYTQ